METPPSTGGALAGHLTQGTTILGMLSTVNSPQPGTVGGSSSVSTYYSYTPLGDVQQVEAPPPNSSGIDVFYNFAYSNPEALGEPATITDPNQHTAQYFWSPRGELEAVEDAAGKTTTMQYNDAGQLMTITYPATGEESQTGHAYTVVDYSYIGGPETEVDIYGETGNLERKVTQGLGNEGEVKAENGFMGTGWPGNGEQGGAMFDQPYRVQHLYDGNNNSTTPVFNPAGALQSLQYPMGDQMQLQNFDRDLNPQQYVDGLTRSTSLFWNNNMDQDDSLAEIQFPPNTEPNRYFYYDQYGRVTEIRDQTGPGSGSYPTSVYDYSYDDDDNVVMTTTTYATVNQGDTTSGQLDPIEVSYGYNPDGSRATMTVSDGGGYTFQYSRDSGGRIQSIQCPWNGWNTGAPEVLSYAWSANDWLTGQAGTLIQATFAPDNRGRSGQIHYQNGSQSTGYTDMADFAGYFANHGVAYGNIAHDASGNILSDGWWVPHHSGYGLADQDGEGVAYTYQNRTGAENYLTGEVSSRGGGADNYSAYYSVTYSADSAGNYTSLPSLNGAWPTNYQLQMNQDNQVTSDSVSGNQYTYDGDGNTTFMPWLGYQGHTGHTVSLGWDAEDHLHNWGLAMFCAYRPDGLRAHKTQSGAEGHRYFVYDGSQVVAVYDDDNGNTNLLELRAWGPAGLAERYSTDGSPHFYAYAFDPSGNCVERVNSASNVYLGYAPYDLQMAYNAQGIQLGA